MSSDDDEYRWWSEHQHRYGVNTRIMLTAIISLVFVIVMVVLLHFYARFILRRQARRRQAMLQLGIGVSTATSNHQSQPPGSSSGLDPSVISSLPVFIYKKRASTGRPGDDDDGANIAECSVCLSTLEEDEVVKLLPNCKHSFHTQCIDMWLNGHSNCPVCRTEAKPRTSNSTTTTTTGSEITTTEEASSTTATAASAPPLDSEGTAESRSTSRLSSFRRMVSRERSMRRVQPCEGAVDHQGRVADLERQS